MILSEDMTGIFWHKKRLFPRLFYVSIPIQLSAGDESEMVFFIAISSSSFFQLELDHVSKNAFRTPKNVARQLRADLLSKILVVNFQLGRCRQGFVGDQRHCCGDRCDMDSRDNTGGIRSSGADLREWRGGVGATESQSSKFTRRRIRAGRDTDLTRKIGGVCGERNDSAFASSSADGNCRRWSSAAYVAELRVSVRRYFGRDNSAGSRSAHKEQPRTLAPLCANWRDNGTPT
jgi:hypothetical protein